jgi:hypothetical protein
MLLFQKENWGKAYEVDDDLSSFLELSGADDASGSLLHGARKVDVNEGGITGLNSVHIRETVAADIPNNDRISSTPHHNNPPEDDFMYNSMTASSGAADRLRKAMRGSQQSSQSGEGDLGPRGLSVTSL